MVLRPPYQLIFFSPQITLAFLMSVLLKKPFLTGLAVFLLTIFWGSLGFTALYKHLPAFMEWSLCFLSPFAFTTGMAQVRSKIIVFCFFHVIKIYFYLFGYGCLCTHAQACCDIRGQRTTWQVSVLSFHHEGCRGQTQALLPVELSLLSHDCIYVHNTLNTFLLWLI